MPLFAEGLTAEINLASRTGNNCAGNGKVWSVGACGVVRGMTLNPGHLSVTCTQPACSTMAFLQLGHCFAPHSQSALCNYTGKGFGPSGSSCLHWSWSIPAFHLLFCFQTIQVQGQGQGSPGTALSWAGFGDSQVARGSDAPCCVQMGLERRGGSQSANTVSRGPSGFTVVPL